jgi:hypothetical protein
LQNRLEYHGTVAARGASALDCVRSRHDSRVPGTPWIGGAFLCPTGQFLRCLYWLLAISLKLYGDRAVAKEYDAHAEAALTYYRSGKYGPWQRLLWASM